MPLNEIPPEHEGMDHFEPYAPPDDLDYEAGEMEEEEKPKAKPRKPPKRTSKKKSSVESSDWYAQAVELFGGDEEIKVRLSRAEPTRYRGIQISGLLEEFPRIPDPLEVKNTHGGGRFKIQVMVRHPDTGSWVYGKHFTFEIAGPPLLEHFGIQEEKPPKMTAPEDTTLSREAMKMAARHADQERERAERLEQLSRTSGQVSSEMIELFREMALKRDDGGIKELLASYMGNEGARIDRIRESHESELRQLRQSHQDDLKRKDDYWQRQLDMLKAQSDREISTMENSHTRELATLKEVHAREVSSLERQSRSELESARNLGDNTKQNLQFQYDRVAEELVSVKKELAEVKAKKDKGFSDMMREIMEQKEILETVGLIGGQEEEGFADKAVAIAGPLVEALSKRVTTPPSVQGNPAAPTQALPPEASPPAEPTRGWTKGEAEAAGKYIQSCMGNGVEPATVIKQAIDIGVNPALLEQITRMEVDQLLDELQILDGAPLRSQEGRNYLRKMIHLLRGEPA